MSVCPGFEPEALSAFKTITPTSRLSDNFKLRRLTSYHKGCCCFKNYIMVFFNFLK